MSPRKICVLIPVYNEEGIIETLHERLDQVSKTLPYEFDFLFVNDGSADGSLEKLIALSRRDRRLLVLDLTRNFGQHASLTAGLQHAEGDAVIMMDADLEDNPRHIADLIKAWEEGFEVVYALRGKRDVGWLRRLGSNLYHRLSALLEHHLPTAGTFSLMDRRVVEALKLMPERNRYIPGLRALAGFRQKGLLFDRGPRYDSRPRVSLLRLVRLALDSTVAFSKIPLKAASMMGLFFSVTGFLAIIFIVVYQMLLGFKISGWSSLIVTVIFASGIQLLCLGILGEYVAQILDEVKGRPVFLLRAKIRDGRAF
jgi:dolichol-phosphate mannosyltransferase